MIRVHRSSLQRDGDGVKAIGIRDACWHKVYPNSRSLGNKNTEDRCETEKKLRGNNCFRIMVLPRKPKIKLKIMRQLKVRIRILSIS